MERYSLAGGSVRKCPRLRDSSGFSLIEVMGASLILLIGLVATMNLFTVAIGQDANQGEFATRVTEYCQDKMEQLMGLNFTDGTTDTTVYPVVPGGTGLGGNMAVSTTVGGINPASPVTGYVDYLSETGTLLPGSATSFYVRQWSISTDSTGKLKTITVFTRATVARGIGPAPSTTLVCYKSSTS